MSDYQGDQLRQLSKECAEWRSVAEREERKVAALTATLDAVTAHLESAFGLLNMRADQRSTVSADAALKVIRVALTAARGVKGR